MKVKTVVKSLGIVLIIIGTGYLFGTVGSRDRGLITFGQLCSGSMKSVLIAAVGFGLVGLSRFSLRRFKEGLK